MACKLLTKEDKKKIVHSLIKMIEFKKNHVKNMCTNQNGTLNFAGDCELNEIKEYELLVKEIVGDIKVPSEKKEVWI